MKNLVKTHLFLLLALSIYVAPLSGIDLLIRTPEGGNFMLDVTPGDTIYSIQEQIDGFLHEESGQGTEYAHHPARVQEFWLDFSAFSSNRSNAAASNVRVYKPLTNAEREDIGYIVTSLANKSIPSILKNKSSLDSAGARVEHVHPLRFLEAVFTDESLKVGIRNIKKRGWIWKDFMNGIARSMTEESARGNLRDDQVAEFASIVGIDYKIIAPTVKSSKWEHLVDQLISNVPRSGDAGRYDM